MKIAVATTTRADWGLLSPLCSELQSRGADLYILAAGMHFDPAMGLTYREIEADGFPIAARIETPGNPAEEGAACLTRYYAELQRLSPDCIVCLGDRFEMLSIAMAAALAHVPIVHIAGGAISEGAFDDAFRHAITKLASLHLVETPEYRQRVISMGEDPDRVIHTGAIGVYNILNVKPISLQELEASIDFKFKGTTLLCTMHAATMDPAPPTDQLRALLDALAQRPDLRVLFTHPNNDVDPTPLIGMLNDFASQHPDIYRVIPSLGRVRYITALHHAAAVIGNSSGGIVEVPSMGIPTLDIGIRQRGRTAAPSVIHVPDTTADILHGLDQILSPEHLALSATRDNPYYLPDTPWVMADAILSTDFSSILPKTFYTPV